MSQMIRRLLQIDLPACPSAFRWGPRKTEKSTRFKQAFPRSITFDFLDTEPAIDLARKLSLLRERILAPNPKSSRSPSSSMRARRSPQSSMKCTG